MHWGICASVLPWCSSLPQGYGEPAGRTAGSPGMKSSQPGTCTWERNLPEWRGDCAGNDRRSACVGGSQAPAFLLSHPGLSVPFPVLRAPGLSRDELSPWNARVSGGGCPRRDGQADELWSPTAENTPLLGFGQGARKSAWNLSPVHLAVFIHQAGGPLSFSA